jgi:hypothetical protein
MPPLELGPTGQVIPEISTTLKVNNWGDRWGDNESRKTRFILFGLLVKYVVVGKNPAPLLQIVTKQPAALLALCSPSAP